MPLKRHPAGSPPGGRYAKSARSDDTATEKLSLSDDPPVESEPTPAASVGAAVATAITGGAVGGSAAGLMTGFGGVGVAFAGGAVGVAAAPVVIGAGLIGAGTVLALKGFNVPVDEAASKAARMVKNAAVTAAPAVWEAAAHGAVPPPRLGVTTKVDR